MSVNREIQAGAGIYYLVVGTEKIGRELDKASSILDAPQKFVDSYLKALVEKGFEKAKPTDFYKRGVEIIGNYLYALPSSTQKGINRFENWQVEKNQRSPNCLSKKIIVIIAAYKNGKELSSLEKGSEYIENIAQVFSPYDPSKICHITTLVMQDVRVILQTVRPLIEFRISIKKWINNRPDILLRMFYNDKEDEIDDLDFFNAHIRKSIAEKLVPKDEAKRLLDQTKTEILTSLDECEASCYKKFFPQIFTTVAQKGVQLALSATFRWYVYDLTAELTAATCEYGMSTIGLEDTFSRDFFLVTHKIIKWGTMIIFIRHELTTYEKNRNEAVENIKTSARSYREKIKTQLSESLANKVETLKGSARVVKDYINDLLVQLGRTPPRENDQGGNRVQANPQQGWISWLWS
ncbi:MAG: hypothetical protein KDK76_05090 [Chlamydiia bacterium]|nr:hypothetical protein [Chlamydiia bacterium]